MLINYFKTACRNLWKSRFYTGINILGLAIGLAVGIIILLWVKDELGFDRFNSKANNIYRVKTHLGTGSSAQTWASTPAPVAVYGKSQVAGIKNAVRIATNYDISLYTYQNKQFTKINSAFIDPSFFSIFDIKLLQGNAAQPFPDPSTVLITSATAKKMFGNDNPIGKVIVADKKYNFTVGGVLQDFPGNSSLQYDMLFPISILEAEFTGNGAWKTLNEDWGNYYFSTFLLVQPGSSITNIEKQLTQFLHRNNEGAKANRFALQPLTQLHLYGADGNSHGMQMVQIFFVVAILLLLIACINYVNLSTARAMLRAKEVSIRKIIGAGKGHLFLQFVIETIILFAIATVLAVCLIALLMPLYNSISGKQASFSITDPDIWTTIGITITCTLLAASIYPAILLSSFKPLQALKGKLSMGIGNALFRKVLVVSQFVFSVILITSTLIIGKQLQYIRQKELGYDKSYVFSFPMRDMQKHYQAVKDELLKLPAVKTVASGGGQIVNLDNTTGDTDWEGKENNRSFLIHPMAIDAGFIPLMKMQMAAGSNFEGTKADSAHFILNETAIKEAGITDPIGKRFKLWNFPGTIVGVVKDFHFVSLKQKIEPAIFYYRPGQFQMYIKTTGKDASKAIAAAAKWWKQYNAGFPFEYTFMDEAYDQLYKSDQRTGTLFNVFAAIAILISCLGLFGLATYTAQIRTKEIGIRKVLGASVTGITHLLAKDFVRLVVLSIAIASPIAWFCMHQWLQDFAYRAPINGWIFLVAGVSALIIALLTISFQSIKAALANPVKSLRTE
jgi:putative ABC transport system permease protein